MASGRASQRRRRQKTRTGWSRKVEGRDGVGNDVAVDGVVVVVIGEGNAGKDGGRAGWLRAGHSQGWRSNKLKYQHQYSQQDKRV